MIDTIKDKLRMGQFGLIGLAMMALVVLFFPGQLGVMVWTLAKLSIAATMGYWIDRLAFPKRRPHEVADPNQADHARYRRAIIIGATLVAMGAAI